MLQGSQRLLADNRVGVITSELASAWLNAQCCSRKLLQHLLRPAPNWTLSCTTQGMSATCVSRPPAANVSVLPRHVLGAPLPAVRPAALQKVVKAAAVCRKTTARFAHGIRSHGRAVGGSEEEVV